MTLLVDDCPRCGADQITFDVTAAIPAGKRHVEWIKLFEAFAVCRKCQKSSIFILELFRYESRDRYDDSSVWTQGHSLNSDFRVIGYISNKDKVRNAPPEHTPDAIDKVFREGAICLSVDCWNAASTMFRLCLDMATRDLLPDDSDEEVAQPNRKQRRDLGLRIPWLLGQGLLPVALGDLAAVVKEDGNDGAHSGNISKEDAEDLLDFTEVLLERLYTEPARVKLAEARAIRRREG